MPGIDLAVVTAADGRDLLAAAQTDWARPVPHCPGWDAAALVGHMGGILAWMGAVVSTGERVSRRETQAPPGDPATLATWYSAHLDDNRVSWWRRRLAVELAIHRWDAQHAAGTGGMAPRPADDAVAGAGIEEFLSEFLPGMLLAQPEASGLAGVLRLQGTDGPGDWWFDLSARTAVAAGTRPASADTTVRGTRSDVLLWLANRAPTPSIRVTGRPDVAGAWLQLCR
jgi:uncharacterized protein (TIGR03083 family)